MYRETPSFISFSFFQAMSISNLTLSVLALIATFAMTTSLSIALLGFHPSTLGFHPSTIQVVVVNWLIGINALVELIQIGVLSGVVDYGNNEWKRQG